MQDLFNFIKEKYQSEFINKIIEYKIRDTQISDFLFNINYSWTFYWLDPLANKVLIMDKIEWQWVKLKNSEIKSQYFLWSLEKDSWKLNNTNLIIATKEDLDEKIEKKLFDLLTFGGYLIKTSLRWGTTKQSKSILILQKPKIPDEFFYLFMKYFEETWDFDKSTLKAMKEWNFKFKSLPTKFNILEKLRFSAEHWINNNNRTQEQILWKTTSHNSSKKTNIEELLTRKKVRSLSWITPITLMTKPFPCPWKCIFCPDDVKMPKSYVREEAACQRSLRLEFDPYKQTVDRLKSIDKAGHNPEKIEVIILWWTFPSYPKDYQEEFVKWIMKALNWIQLTWKKTLVQLQKDNETAKHKMVWFSVEIRPDTADTEILSFLRYLWVTRVEMWVQSLNDEILKINKRLHTVEDVISATKNLKDFWFKIMYHMMLGLPSNHCEKSKFTEDSKAIQNFKNDKSSFLKLFHSPLYKPDQLKIYPCLVIKGTELEKIYKKINYMPYSCKEIIEILKIIKEKYIPDYVRIARITRDIPADLIVKWCKSWNIREILDKELKKEWIKCKCIRCREIKNEIYSKYSIITKKINLNWAIEYYIEARTEDWKCLGLCRLYLSSKKTSIIRELHVYWPTASIKDNERKIQHKWIWSKLLEKAEKLSIKNWYKKIAVISAIWTRWYYRKFWYELENTYMVKSID